MKRVAIILGSPYPQSSPYHLRGVSQDASNYRKYLLSSTGGAWMAKEIHTFVHVTKRQIAYIKYLCHNADIALIIYSGHGFMRAGENYLNINPNERLNVLSLDTTAKRQITITDMCRTNYPYEHLEGIGGIGFSFDNTMPHLARKIYDDFVLSSPFGRLNIFSSSESEASQDTEDGGYFTVSLLSSVNEWSSYTDKCCLSAAGAYIRTLNDLTYLGSVQTPAATFIGEAVPTFPFGISTQAYIRKYGLPSYQVRKKQISDVFANVLFITGAALLLHATIRS